MELVVVIVLGIIAGVVLKNMGVTRVQSGKVFAGVCAGLAKHFNMSPIGIRVLWVLLSLALGFGIITYIVMCCILPKTKS